MGTVRTSDVGNHLKARCSAASRLVAAGAGDAAEVTGIGIDRTGYGSGKLVIAGHANNTAAKKVQLTSVKLSYSDDNSSWSADVEQLAASYDLVTGTGDNYGQYELNINFGANKKYVRVKYTPDSTATATDVAEVAAVFVLGGADTLPAV